MGKVVAQVNYNSTFQEDISREEKKLTAETRVQIPGFIWKVWLRNEEAGRGGGIFLFEDRPSAEAWLVERVNRNFGPAFSNITVELFDVDEELTRISLGPIDLAEEA